MIQPLQHVNMAHHHIFDALLTTYSALGQSGHLNRVRAVSAGKACLLAS